MATATFSGNGNYQLEANATRSGRDIYVDVYVNRIGSYTAWSTAQQAWGVNIDGNVMNTTWTYDFRSTTRIYLGRHRVNGLAIGNRGWSATVNMASGIGSATVTGTVNIPPDAPSAPTLGTVTRVSDTSQTITWTRVASATAPYTSQQVQRREFNGSWSAFATIFTANRTETANGAETFTDTSTTANKLYQYRVVAFNSSGSAASATGPYTYTTPSAPGVTLEATSSTQVTATVDTKVPHGNYKNELQYSSAGGAWTALTTLAAGVDSYTWTPPAAASIQVRSRTVIVAPTSTDPGNGLASGYANSNTVPLQSPPLAPTNLTPNGANVDRTKAVAASWTYTSTDTSAQTAYEVQRSTDGGTTWTGTGKVLSTSKTYNFAANTFTAGQVVTWRVRTWGVHATAGPWSNNATFTAQTAPAVTITSPLGISETSLASVTWAAVTGQAAWKAELYRESELLQARSGSGTTRTVNFTPKLENGSSYTIRVQVQASTGLWSEWSETVFAADFPTPAPADVALGWDDDQGAVLVTIENPATPVNELRNPSFEVDSTGWLVLNGSAFVANTAGTANLTPNTGNWPGSHGLKFMLATADGTSSFLHVRTDPAAAHRYAISAGQWLGFKAWFATDSAMMVKARVSFYTADGTFITAVYAGGDWVQGRFYAGNEASIVLQAPATTASAIVELVAVSDPYGVIIPAGKRLWVDRGQLHRSWYQEDVEYNLSQPYFDGDTPGASWTGAPNASSSIRAQASTNTVLRSYDGINWQTVAEGVPLDATISDPEVVLNEEVFYKIQTVSTLDTVGESIVRSLTTLTKSGYWSVGPGFTMSLAMRLGLGDPPGIDLETGLAAKELHYFAGRTLPVEFAGVQRQRSGQATFMVPSLAERNQAIEMSYQPAPHLFRLPDGTFLYASIEPASTHRVDEGFYTIEVSMQEVSK